MKGSMSLQIGRRDKFIHSNMHLDLVPGSIHSLVLGDGRPPTFN